MDFNNTFLVTLLVSITASLSAVADQTAVAPKNYLMAAMGDSITAGFLAATNLDWFNSPGQTLSQDGEDFITAVEAISGIDSAQAQFSWTGELAHVFETRTTKSWATGLEL